MSFTQARNLSIRDSWLVLAIAAARLLLKEAPKCPHCALARIYTKWQQNPLPRDSSSRRSPGGCFVIVPHAILPESHRFGRIDIDFSFWL